MPANDSRSSWILFLLLLLALAAGRSSSPASAPSAWDEIAGRQARADAGFDATYLVQTAGIVSSSGSTAVAVLTFPGGYVPPAKHRFWVGGVTVFNTDTSTRMVELKSHTSGRVLWGCPLPAGSTAIIDNTNMVASDQGTTAAPEGIDLVTESGATNTIGVVGQGYVR